MSSFFQVQNIEKVFQYTKLIKPLPSEVISIEKGLGRVLATNLTSPDNLPNFPRACMDGYAVYSADVFGSSNFSPNYLDIIEEIFTGQEPVFNISSGQCSQIMTGGMIPKGADAVVKIEHTNLINRNTLEIIHPVAPGENILTPNTDVTKGQPILSTGHYLRPQDLGLLAALGIENIPVIRKPQVGIISTGNEIVPINITPSLGKIREVNSYMLMAAIKASGGIPKFRGLIPDNIIALKNAVYHSVIKDDLTLVSGGSSIGSYDLTSQIFLSLPKTELLIHGLSISPGKPFIWVKMGHKNLLGLPGQVASCLISFYLLVEPIIERQLGNKGTPFTRFGRVLAKLTRNLPSASGREEYIRVKLIKKNNEISAEPILGKSALLRTLIESDGLIRIERNCEGLTAGIKVVVLTWPI